MKKTFKWNFSTINFWRKNRAFE